MNRILVRESNLYFYRDATLECIVLEVGRVLAKNEIYIFPDFYTALKWACNHYAVT